jgi:hypothetical protein
VILAEPRVGTSELRRRTGWELKPEGICKGDLCVALPEDAVDGGLIDVRALAERLRMPLLQDGGHGLWVLGPESLTGRALTTAAAPDLQLPDLDGSVFSLSSLRGRKVVLTAWASW